MIKATYDRMKIEYDRMKVENEQMREALLKKDDIIEALEAEIKRLQNKSDNSDNQVIIIPTC